MAIERPLHILHLTAGSDAGGLSRYVYDLSMALHERGHRVTVAGERGAWHDLFEGAPFRWLDTPLKGGPVGLWKAWRVLGEYLKDKPADVIHAHYRKAALVGRRLQKRERMTPFNDGLGPMGLRMLPPVLYTLHLSHIPMRGVWGWLSDFGDHTHVASAAARDWVVSEAGVPANRVTVIPHGVEAAKFPVASVDQKLAAKAALGFGAFDRVAVFMGRFDVPKNVVWMLDVAAATRERIPRLKVVMMGEGPEEAELRAAVAAQGLEDRVFFVRYGDPVPVYQAADALLLPSAREGFSLVTAEAMAAGVPVLRTRTSGAGETIVEGVTGRTTEIDRAKFLIAAADFLADDTGLARMGKAAAEFVREKLTFERQVEETIGLYRRLADG